MNLHYAKQIINETRGNYNLIADDFSRTRKALWPELSFLRDYIKNGDRVLDLGCGNGRLMELFRDKDVEYIGIDNSERMIEIAKRKFQTPKFRIDSKFIVADGLSLPFPDEYFDKIFSVAILHHIPSKELRLKFLQEARRVLKQDGAVVFTVWNLWQRRYFWTHVKYFLLKIFVFSRLDFKDLFIPWRAIPRYYHCFTIRELRHIFMKAGLDVEKASGLFRNGKKLNHFLFAKRHK